MKYRDEHYERPEQPGQVFEELIDEWKFSEVDNCPVIVGKINQQKAIQQYGDCSLAAILDRFLPEEKAKIYSAPVTFSDEVIDQRASVFRDDLNELSAVLESAEDFRERYGLSEDFSAAQVFAEVEKRANAGLERLKEYSLHGEVKHDPVRKNPTDSGRSDSVPNNDTFVSTNNKQSPIKNNPEGENKQ